MKFGVNTFIWAGEFGPAQFPLLPLIREHGFDGVELPLFTPDAYRPAELRRTLEANSLECTFCSVMPAGLSIVHEDAAVRNKARLHLEACAEAVGETGASIMAGPLYSPVGYLPGRRRTEEEWKWAVDCYQKLGPKLESIGVTFAIEPLNRFETYFLNTTDDAVALCSQVGHPNIGILFDTFHANIEEKDVPAACRAAAPHLKHFHASENDRGTPGTGHTDWSSVFEALLTMGYDGWMTIESFGFSIGQLSAAASIWRDLAPSANSIAFDGVQFLRKGVAAAAASSGR